MTAPDPALTARAEAAYPPSQLIEDYDGDRFVDDEWGYDEAQRAAFIAGALSEREAHNEADLNAELGELRAWKANAEITLHEDLSVIRRMESVIDELRIRISAAQALRNKPGAHKEHVLAELDPDA